MKFKKIKINGCDVHRDGFRSIFTIEISENKNWQFFGKWLKNERLQNRFD